MSSRLIKLVLLLGAAGQVTLFQQGCIDPDLFLRAGLQAFNNTLVFALDNALAGL